MKKQVLALLLCLVLIVSFVPVGARAAGEFYLNPAEGSGRYHYVAPHANETLSVTAYSYDDGQPVTEGLTYKWETYENYTWTECEGATESSYVVTDVTASSARYRCTATKGDISSDYTFYVYASNDFGLEAKDNQTSIAVAPGEDAVLTVVPEGHDLEGVTYQWRDGNNADIQGATDASFTVEAVSSRSQYSCYANDAYGNGRYVYFTVSVENNLKVEADSNVDGIAPNTPAVMKVKVSATDMDGITYAWHTNSLGGEALEGGDTDTYTVENITKDSVKQYWCQVTDKYGNGQSVSFFIRVNNQMKATLEGESNTVRVAPGENATLTVNVTALDMDGVTYQWQKNYSNIEGATGASYTVENVRDYSTNYRCKIEDKYGTTQYVYAYVYVNNQLTAKADGSSDISVAPGGSTELKLTVSACDMEGVTYTWYDPDSAVIQGAESAALTLENITRAGSYRCYVRDAYNSYQNVYFYVKVDNQFSVEADGETQIEVEPGETATMKVNISAADKDGLVIKWYDMDYNEIEGADGDSYTPEKVTRTGSYHVYVADKYSNTANVYFYLSVDNEFTAEADGALELDVGPGESCEMKVKVGGKDLEGVTYSWMDGNSYTTIEGADGPSYTVENVTSRRSFRCYVQDAYGNSKYLWFYVTVDNQLSLQADGSTTPKAEPNGSLELKVLLSAKDMDSVTLQWYDNDYNEIEGATGASYTVESVTQPRRFYCRASDQYGNTAEVSFRVSVDNGFSAAALGDKTEYSVVPGGSCELQVKYTAKDTNGLTIQWYDSDSGEAIEGATDAAYTVENVTGRRQLYCQVADQYGNSTAIWFYVYVDNAFSVEADGNTDFAVQVGESVTMKVAASATDMSRLTYVWYGPDGRLDGVDGASYTAENVQSYGQYRCTVADQYDNSRTIWFYVHIDNGFSARPQGSDGGNSVTVSVAPGGDAELKALISAKDTEGLEIRWYDNNYRLISGANGDSYTVTKVNNRVQYHCEVEDKYGNEETLWFTVRVDNGLTARAEDSTGNSRDVYVEEGGDAVLKVIVTAKDASQLTYRWTDSESGETISGATTDTLTVKNVNAYRSYSCRVTDQYGNSANVWFYVGVDNDFVVKASGAEAGRSRTLSAALGSDVTLTVEVTAKDMEGVTYQWNLDKGGAVEGATTESFTIRDLREYTSLYCRVTDKFGNNETISFYVQVDNDFTAYAEQERFSVALNGSAELKVIASAKDTEGMTYQWYDQNYKKIGSATGDSLTVENVNAYSQYRCEVADKYGNRSSIWFYVSVDNALSVTSGQRRIAVPLGEDTELKVIVTAKDMEGLTYQWFESTENGNVALGNGSSLIVEDVETYRSFYCRVRDKYNNSSNTWFYVSVDNELKASPVGGSEQALEPGSSVTLKVNVTAKDLEGVTYRWEEQYLNEKGYNSTRLIEGALTDTLEVKDLSMSRTYYCRVTDKYGTPVTATFNLYIDNEFQVLLEGNHTQLTELGGSVTLTVNVSAADMEGVTYTWERYTRDGNNSWMSTDSYADKGSVDPATGVITLTVENIREAYMYQCTVRDKFGNTQRINTVVGPDNHLAVSYGAGTSTRNYVTYGGSATVSVAVSADDTEGLIGIWYEYIRTDDYSDRIPVADAEGLSITAENVTKARQFIYEVQDKFGNTDNITIYVGPDNGFTVSALNGVREFDFKEGSTVTLGVTVTANDTEGLTYRWQEWKAISNNSGSYSDMGVDGSTAAVDHAGEFRCTVTDKFGNQLSVSFEVAPGLGKKNGVLLDADGYRRYYKDDVFQSQVTGLVKSGSNSWYVIGGVVAADANGLTLCGDTWAWLKAGRVDTTVTGLQQNESGWWYVQKGILDMTYVGLVENESGTWYVYNGQLATWQTGLTDVNGTICEIENGALCVWHSELILYNGEWLYLNKGKLDLEYTGLAENPNGWWYVTDGHMDFTFTGLQTNEFGTWYVYKGQLVTWRDGLESIDGNLYYIYQGQLAEWHSGLMQYGDSWIYVTKGVFDPTYTGLAQNEYGWWYVTNGVLDLTFTGLATNESGTFYIYLGQFANWRTGYEWVNGEYCEFYQGQLTTWSTYPILVYPGGEIEEWVPMIGGRVAPDFTGIAKNDNGYWYVFNGHMDFTFTGLTTNAQGTWFVYKGQLVTWKDGIQYVESEGKNYYIYQGQVCEWYTGDIEEGGVVYHVTDGVVTSWN